MDTRTLADLPGQNEPSLDHLFSMAKIKKNELTLAQADYDQALFALVAASDHEEEGSKTFTTNSGQKYQIIRKVNRKLDGKKLQLIRSRIPENLLPLKVEEVLDKKKLTHLMNNEPDTYRLLAQAIIATPGKAAIQFVNPEESV